MYALENTCYFRDLDWEKLKTFYYVAKMGNISHAAPLLNLTQSSSSRHISGLEKHLGYPLFARKQDGVILTRKGEELFEIAEKVFVEMKGFASRSFAPLKPGQKRRIRIATSQDLAAYLINDLVLEYNKSHPDLVFEVMEVDQAIDVILHDIDIAIQLQESKWGDEKWQIIKEPFFIAEKKLYASSGYLKKHGEPKSVDDLKHHHFIIPSTELGQQWILEISNEGGKGLNPVFLSNSLECLIEAARQGKGIISAYDKTKIVQNSTLKNILPDLTIKKRQEYFVYPEYLKEDKDIMDLKEYLRRNIGKTHQGDLHKIMIQNKQKQRSFEHEI